MASELDSINSSLNNSSPDNFSLEGSARVNPSPKKTKKIAPMLAQYLEYKERFKQQIVLFQVGDFYEVFYDDAKKASEILDIRLTARHKDQPDPVPMCGFPIQSLTNYLPKIISKGVGCVVVSQVESGSSNKKGMVAREIERIVTPGLRYLEDGLDEKSFNYLAAVCLGPGGGGVAYIDVSTGILKLEEIENEDELTERLRLLEPSELILPSSFWGTAQVGAWLKKVKKFTNSNKVETVFRSFKKQNKEELAKRIAKLISKEGQYKTDFSSATPAALSSMAAVLDYVENYSFDGDFNLSSCQIKKSSFSVVLDSSSRENLEVLNNTESSSSLVNVLDQTKTAFGSRLLRERLLFPEVCIEKIENRLQGTESFINNQEELSKVREHLSGIRDLERLSSRLSSGRIAPYDIGVLRDSISHLPKLKSLLEKLENGPCSILVKHFDSLEDLHTFLTTSLTSEPPVKLSEGGIIKDGYNKELDELISISKDANSCLLKFELEEKERSQISVLKVKYNSVFGYFIEISKANLAKIKIPESYQRKQTLTNAERFITPELKELEVKILSAKARQISLEKELFSKIKLSLLEHRLRIQKVSKILAEVDVLSAGAYLAIRNNYVRPKISENNSTKIIRGRHPIVERLIGIDKFTPNDSFLEASDSSSKDGCSFAILSGPNMGGKSTFMRQIGLIQLMAQAGFYVPASEAEIGIVDRIFTRIGASDNLNRGESTFMVEMREAASIVRSSTKKSLVLVDELGRGTATNDGYALAQSILEWLHDRVGCRTVFATHFHGLSNLAETKKNMFLLSVGANKVDGNISFTYRIEEKAASGSYGTEVAKLAGLPEEIIKRAETILKNKVLGSGSEKSLARQITLEEIPSNSEASANKENLEKVEKVLNYFDKLNVNSLSPIDALNELFKFKSEFN